MKIERTCSECGKLFTEPRKVSKGDYYCSRACRDAAHYKIGCAFQIGDVLGMWKVAEDLGLQLEGVKHVRKRHIWLMECTNCGNQIKKITHEVKRNKLHDCQKCGGRLKGEGGFQLKVDEYKRGAKDRDLEWSLTGNDCRELFKGNCHYCESLPSQIYGCAEWAKYICNGIDRIENDKGYIKSNCWSCCKLCNVMKMALTPDEFLTHIAKIASCRWKKQVFSPYLYRDGEILSDD